MFGMEAGLFFPSGTQSNLAALMAHCAARRGGDRRAGARTPTTTRAAARPCSGSIQPQPLANQPDGTLDLAEVEAAIKPDDSHFAITRLLALENTIGGKVIGRDYLAEAVDARAGSAASSTHLDGARIFNAAVKLGMPVKELCAGFDTVSVCLSKGLGAPAGTVLVGHGGAHRQRAAHPQDAGRRHAAGRDARRRGPARARAPRRAPRRRPRQRRSAWPTGWSAWASPSSRCRPTWCSRRFPQEALRAAAGSTWRGGDHGVRRPRTRLVTHLDVDAGGIDRKPSRPSPRSAPSRRRRCRRSSRRRRRAPAR